MIGQIRKKNAALPALFANGHQFYKTNTSRVYVSNENRQLHMDCLHDTRKTIQNVTSTKFTNFFLSDNVIFVPGVLQIEISSVILNRKRTNRKYRKHNQNCIPVSAKFSLYEIYKVL